MQRPGEQQILPFPVDCGLPKQVIENCLGSGVGSMPWFVPLLLGD